MPNLSREREREKEVGGARTRERRIQAPGYVHDRDGFCCFYYVCVISHETCFLFRYLTARHTHTRGEIRAGLEKAMSPTLYAVSGVGWCTEVSAARLFEEWGLGVGAAEWREEIWSV